MTHDWCVLIGTFGGLGAGFLAGLVIAYARGAHHDYVEAAHASADRAWEAYVAADDRRCRAVKWAWKYRRESRDLQAVIDSDAPGWCPNSRTLRIPQGECGCCADPTEVER